MLTLIRPRYRRSANDDHVDISQRRPFSLRDGIQCTLLMSDRQIEEYLMSIADRTAERRQ